MASILTFLHVRLALSLVLFAIVLGIWGTYQFLRHRAVSGGFRSGFLLMAGLTAAQSLAGLAIYALGQRPGNALHVVYGIFAALFLPGLYFFTNRGRRDREAAFLAAACWIVLVAYARGITTGR